jgi:hypothetical protein
MHNVIDTTSPAEALALIVGETEADIDECRERALKIGTDATACEYEDGAAQAGVTLTPGVLAVLAEAIEDLVAIEDVAP